MHNQTDLMFLKFFLFADFISFPSEMYISVVLSHLICCGQAIWLINRQLMERGSGPSGVTHFLFRVWESLLSSIYLRFLIWEPWQQNDTDSWEIEHTHVF